VFQSGREEEWASKAKTKGGPAFADFCQTKARPKVNSNEKHGKRVSAFTFTQNVPFVRTIVGKNQTYSQVSATPVKGGKAQGSSSSGSGSSASSATGPKEVEESQQTTQERYEMWASVTEGFVGKHYTKYIRSAVTGDFKTLWDKLKIKHSTVSEDALIALEKEFMNRSFREGRDDWAAWAEEHQAKLAFLETHNVAPNDITVQRYLLNAAVQHPKMKEAVKDIRKENGLEEDPFKEIDIEEIHTILLKHAQGEGVAYGKPQDRNQDSAHYADLTQKRPPRPKITPEMIAEMGTQVCQRFENGTCKFGDKCYRLHHKQGSTGKTGKEDIKCHYCEKMGHMKADCRKKKADEEGKGKGEERDEGQSNLANEYALLGDSNTPSFPEKKQSHAPKRSFAQRTLGDYLGKGPQALMTEGTLLQVEESEQVAESESEEDERVNIEHMFSFSGEGEHRAKEGNSKTNEDGTDRESNDKDREVKIDDRSGNSAHSESDLGSVLEIFDILPIDDGENRLDVTREKQEEDNGSEAMMAKETEKEPSKDEGLLLSEESL
jgi:hypothetical protein